MIQKLLILVSFLAVLVGLLVQSTSASSLKWLHSRTIGDPAGDQALEAVAARLNAMTNLSADPCDDFYKFACGRAKWQRSGESISSKLSEIVESRLNYLITRPKSEEPETKGAKLMRNLLYSYEARHTTMSRNFASIVDLVRELGGIPALGERSGWIEGTQTSWTDLTVQLRRLGLQTDLFFNLRVGQNYANQSQSAIYLSLPHVESHMSDQSREDYELLAKQYLMPDMTGAEASRFEEQLDATIKFRLELNKIFQISGLKRNERRNSSKLSRLGFQPYDFLQLEKFQSMSVKSLQLLVPQLDWAGFMSEMFQYPISSETDIFINKPESFVMVQKLIQSQTNPDVLRNFMMLEAIHDVTLVFRRGGIDLIESELGLVLSSEYARNFLLPETRASATIMVDYLRRELKTMIGEADWISDMAKQGALAKADSMISYVGYPDELLDETKMDELYSGIEFDPVNYIANLRSINKWKTRYESAMLGQPSNMFSWHVWRRGTLVNAFYYPEYNSINILPTMMQDFLYNSHQPNYVNFAALGFIVGHEISHAFDSNCIKYDCYGQDHCWWDPKTGAEYQQRSKCFEQQYNGSQVFGPYTWLNGTRTLGENIADNIGAKIARRAYQSWLADQPASYQEPLLTGSLAKYNQDQLFWTSLAQFWCEKEERLDDRDVHSPEKLRVDITLSNQAEFAEAFQCRIRSRMNPNDRCTMW